MGKHAASKSTMRAADDFHASGEGHLTSSMIGPAPVAHDDTPNERPPRLKRAAGSAVAKVTLYRGAAFEGFRHIAAYAVAQLCGRFDELDTHRARSKRVTDFNGDFVGAEGAEIEFALKAPTYGFAADHFLREEAHTAHADVAHDHLLRGNPFTHVELQR